jgi:hypothetical protein
MMLSASAKRNGTITVPQTSLTEYKVQVHDFIMVINHNIGEGLSIRTQTGAQVGKGEGKEEGNPRV